MPQPPATDRAGSGQGRDNLRGFGFLLLGFFLFSSTDTMVKVLTDTMHPIQIIWFRQLGLVLVAGAFLARRGVSVLRSAHPGLQIARGALAAVSAVSFVLALKFVPLADVVAVSFVSPFLVTVLGALLLRERVPVSRWVAVATGFVGVVVIIRPGLGVFHPAIFLVLVAATAFAMRQVLSRSLAASDDSITTLSFTALVSFLLLTVPQTLIWEWPVESATLIMLAAIALLAGVGEFMVIRAFQMAEVNTVAPAHYSLMIWATAYGWLVFGQLPDLWTWAGTGVILATGLYLIRAESRPIRLTRI